MNYADNLFEWLITNFVHIFNELKLNDRTVLS